MNLSSIVVQTKPEYLSEVIEKLKNSDLCEYHLNDEKGRIVITIEGEGVSEEIGKLKVIQEMPHIISAEMMYSYSEDELNELKDKLENTDKLPDWLNDENAKAEDIRYHGDLKKRF